MSSENEENDYLKEVFSNYAFASGKKRPFEPQKLGSADLFNY